MLGEKSKNNSAFNIILLLFALGVVLISIFGSSIKISPEVIKLKGIFGTSIQVQDIIEVKLIDNLLPGTRLNGISLGTIDIGTYHFKNLGIINIYITRKEFPYLLITGKNKSLLIGNGKTTNQEYYNTIRNIIN